MRKIITLAAAAGAALALAGPASPANAASAGLTVSCDVTTGCTAVGYAPGFLSSAVETPAGYVLHVVNPLNGTHLVFKKELLTGSSSSGRNSATFLVTPGNSDYFLGNRFTNLDVTFNSQPSASIARLQLLPVFAYCAGLAPSGVVATLC